MSAIAEAVSTVECALLAISILVYLVEGPSSPANIELPFRIGYRLESTGFRTGLAQKEMVLPQFLVTNGMVRRFY